MAKKGIYIANKKTFTGYDPEEEKIFYFLLSKKNDGATQTEIAKGTGIPRTTVIRKLSHLVDEEFPWKNKKYAVIRENKKYCLLEKGYSISGMRPAATQKDATDFENRFENAVENLSKTNPPFEVEKICNNIVHFWLEDKYNLEVKSNIKKLYNDAIYDIASGEKGIYIILKDGGLSGPQNGIILNIEKLCKHALEKRDLNHPSKYGSNENTIKK